MIYLYSLGCDYIVFEDEINELECMIIDNDIYIGKGSIPILLSAPHTMIQYLEERVKLNEPYTKAIALYLNKYCDVNCIIKINDTGIDSNRDNNDIYKSKLIKFVKDNNIKLVIDLHGASKNRDFDIEFGTLDNLSADYSTIKELEEAFKHNGLNNITHNDSFKGGAITQYLYNIDDVEVIQLEINGKYRDINNISNLKLVVDSLIYFINQYNDILNK